MVENRKQVANLIAKYLDRTIDQNELKDLEKWRRQSRANEEFFQKAIKTEYLIDAVKDSYYIETDIDFKIQTQLDSKSRGAKGGGKTKVSVMLKWMIAASVILSILVAGSVYYFQNSRPHKNAFFTNELVTNDIKAPTINRATITLSTGKTIYLDSAGNGTLLTSNNVQVVKQADGELVYNAKANTNVEDNIYNTLTNPRGSKIIYVELVDGTKIWLNNESSLKYPLSFSGKERRVILTGEAYFEVAKDNARKFIVETIGSTIQAIGTAFNVNCYPEENSVITTLLEGSVRVADDYEQVVIQPGQETRVSLSEATSKVNRISVKNEADLEAAVAWKDGLIVFRNADIETTMRQISRWYNVDIKFKGEINVPSFFGKIPRTLNLSQVLEVIRRNSDLILQYDSGKVVVSQN